MQLFFKNIKSNTMKSFITAAIIFCSITLNANTGKNNYSPVMTTVNPDESSLLSPLLNLYYGIKNALINSDASLAAAKATEFSKAVKAIDMKLLSDAEMKAFMPVQDKLAAGADKIYSAKNIEAQRTNFATLSADFYALAKAVKLSEEPVYQQYCPMKKAYWLSNETGIKNPYFGKAMLTCGSIKDTIQK